jgi:ADP-ribosylation factor-like protein 6
VMGFFQRLFGALGMSSKACKILVVGLDDAGKTTIMNQIMPKKVRADCCPASFACARAAAVPAVLFYALGPRSVQISRRCAQHQYNEVVPTVGFKIEQFVKNNISFTMFDMSGASTHRDLWTAYYAECDAVIYVVDCKDKLRICVAKKELDDMLENPGVHPRGAGRKDTSVDCVLLS